VSTREERLIENEEIARSVNRRLGAAVASVAEPSQPIPFLCECADHPCLDRVETTVEEYERIHSHPDRFVVVPGHPLVESEQVVADHGDFQVVEKA
jgi:hypothetical protein